MGPRGGNAGQECGTGSRHDAARRKRESGYTGAAETPATGTPGAGAPAGVASGLRRQVPRGDRHPLAAAFAE